MNKTKRYLFSGLKLHVDEFKTAFFNLETKGVYAADNHYYDTYNITELKDFIFVAVDIYGCFNEDKGCYDSNLQVAVKNFQYNLETIRKFPFFVTDYTLDRKNIHILVIRLPENGRNKVKLFFEGKFSEMWNEEEIDKMFPLFNHKELETYTNRNKEIIGILKKKKEFKEAFRKVIEERLGTRMSNDDLENHEGELDILLKQDYHLEVLNYTSSFPILVDLQKSSTIL